MQANKDNERLEREPEINKCKGKYSDQIDTLINEKVSEFQKE